MLNLFPLFLEAANRGAGGWRLGVLIVVAVAVASFFVFRGHAEAPRTQDRPELNRSPRDSGFTGTPKR